MTLCLNDTLHEWHSVSMTLSINETQHITNHHYDSSCIQHNNTQHKQYSVNDIQYNDTQLNDTKHPVLLGYLAFMLNVINAECRLCWVSHFLLLCRVSWRHIFIWCFYLRNGLNRVSKTCKSFYQRPVPRNTKGGIITVPLTSCLTGLESVVWLLTFFVFIWKTD